MRLHVGHHVNNDTKDRASPLLGAVTGRSAAMPLAPAQYIVTMGPAATAKSSELTIFECIELR